MLFSPNDNSTSSAYFIESDGSLRTAGHSRVSDFGSLDTNIRSGVDFASQPVSLAAPDAADQDTAEEDAELDSLDSHLPDFRVVQSPYIDHSANAPSAPVLPTHDGLGSFRANQPVPDAGMQERLYAFEKFNPNRVTRHDETEENDLTDSPDVSQKIQRIESWRMEQSRLVLEHIQKETRTRRSSQSSTATVSRQSTKSTEEEDVVMDKSEDKPSTVVPGEHDHLDWHQGDDSGTESQSILSRVTRTFLKDVIGIDERLLSVLLGDSVPGEEQASSRGESGRPDVLLPEVAPWQASTLERIAKELGVLLNRVSPHPGAFSTYSRMQRMPLPYAGLPVIPEATTAPPPTQVPEHNDGLSATIPDFQPTMAQPTQNVQDSRQFTRRDSGSSSGSSNATFTQEEWEQDLDIKLVFRYLRSRFSSRPSAPASGGTSHLATSSTQDIAAKAARVRAHHPLVASRPRAVERRSFKATAPSSPVLLRHASSCASQSTRRSGRRSSCSSRHYWDIGGSLASGSVIASTGPMGSWGEV